LSTSPTPNDDDETFFLALRHIYHAHLLGRSRLTRCLKRYFSARNLIRVGYIPNPLAAMMAEGTCSSAPPSDEELTLGFSRPRVGRGRYGVVGWARGVGCGAGAVGRACCDGGVNACLGVGVRLDMDMDMEGTRAHTPALDKAGTCTSIQTTPVEVGVLGGCLGVYHHQDQEQQEQQTTTTATASDTFWPSLPLPLPPSTTHGHIELEEGWAVGRIVGAVFLVLVASMAVVVIWTVVGVSPGIPSDSGGVLVGAGGRVQEALLMGLLVLGIGGVEVAVWMGISWVVM